MTFHPYHYERLVAERHAQIQRDMQASRARIRPQQPRTSAQPALSKLDTRLQEHNTQQQATGQQSQTLLPAC